MKSIQQYSVGIDLGGTKINVGIVDSFGCVVKSKKILTSRSLDVDVIVQQIVSLVQELTVGFPVKTLGLGVPGLVDSEKGIVHFAPNLKWNHVPLKSKLKQYLDLEIFMTNDVRAATFGEWQFGAGAGCQNFICIVFGTGIGGGIVSNGVLLQGYSNVAGEVGHIVVDINGPKCSCGSFGCLEAFSGGWAIAQKAREEVLNNPEGASYLLAQVNNNLGAIDAKLVASSAKEGDECSMKIIRRASSAIVAASLSLVNLLNPQKIILSGSVFEGIAGIIEEIQTAVKLRAIGKNVGDVEILPSTLGQMGAVIGASQSYKINL